MKSSWIGRMTLVLVIATVFTTLAALVSASAMRTGIASTDAMLGVDGTAYMPPATGTLYAVQVYLYDCGTDCRPPAGYYSVWGGRPQGTLRRIRGSHPGDFSTPVPAMVSPNRRWLVHANRKGKLVLRGLDRNGQRVRPRRRVVPKPVSGNPLISWSPDSRRLVLAYWFRGQLWTMRRDGSLPRQIPIPSTIEISADVDQYQMPAWSRSGWIAFVGLTREEFDIGVLTERIYAIRPDGSGLTALTAPRKNHNDTAPAWSSSGRHLAYVHDAYEAQGKLIVLDTKTQTRRVLDRHGGASAWSPDDRWIAYNSEDGAFIRRSNGKGRRYDLSFGSSAIDDGFLSHFDWARR